jgi:hypothetical protein
LLSLDVWPKYELFFRKFHELDKAKEKNGMFLNGNPIDLGRDSLEKSWPLYGVVD